MANRSRLLRRLLVAGAAAVGITGAALAFGGSPAAGPEPSFGDPVSRVVPLLQLEDENGRPTSLSDYRGRVVVLSPFLTLCHEVCPLTTAAFHEMQRQLAREGLGRRVVFAEVTVD